MRPSNLAASPWGVGGWGVYGKEDQGVQGKGQHMGGNPITQCQPQSQLPTVDPRND